MHVFQDFALETAEQLQTLISRSIVLLVKISAAHPNFHSV